MKHTSVYNCTSFNLKTHLIWGNTSADSARPPGAETGAEAGALDETPARTVACRLDAIVRDSGEALSKLQALARTMHDVRRDAHELITHHVHRVRCGQAAES